jgi:multiple sugar transport system substrate-binding protein
MSDLYWDYLGGARIPARSDIAEDPDKWVSDPVLSVFIDQLEFAVPRGPHPNWPEISSYIQNAIQKALSNQATAEEAMKEAANQINSIID